ncbi:hypothetical protein B296_00058504 [Ensete ventricosum]|uniref:Uncharacterized protein n=1 Tax=Ensete ventricosum TaxID=4639 RepID=A0A426X945_ENSVE|nr:hypothetical protein B296_00058504 [Ensete ventricosum]
MKMGAGSSDNVLDVGGYHRLCNPFSTAHAAMCVKEEGGLGGLQQWLRAVGAASDGHSWKITSESWGCTSGVNEVERDNR